MYSYKSFGDRVSELRSISDNHSLNLAEYTLENHVRESSELAWSLANPSLTLAKCTLVNLFGIEFRACVELG